MSEAMEKMRGKDRLPIFPLPLVLMPNELLPLHIFEDRYRAMLRDVAHTGNMFGITRFEPSESFVENPEIGSIGCVAEIRENELMPDGRSNILVIGKVRYRMLEILDAGEPYLVGRVEFFEDEAEAPEELDPLADEVFRIFEQIAKAAFKISGHRGRFPDIERTDPESFSFLCSAAFNFANDLKSSLLAMTSTIDRLNRLREILLKTADEMESSAEIHKVARTNGHSKKKLDV
jgi:Lon protease-like protein